MTAQERQLYDFLAQHQVPRGSESKYTNTIAFFDHVIATQNLMKSKK